MRKILVVDDVSTARMKICGFLIENGFLVVEAEDGVKGLEAAREEQPDLIMLDIVMPRLGGFAVLEQLGEEDDLKHIPVIMMTSRTEREDIIRAIRLGACDYIFKPYDTAEVLRKIIRALEKCPGGAADGLPDKSIHPRI